MTHRPRKARRPGMTPDEAKPHAMALLIELGDAIGDKPAIQAAIARTLARHPDNGPRIILSALAWCFAEHTRLDPDHTPPTTGDAA